MFGLDEKTHVSLRWSLDPKEDHIIDKEVDIFD